MPMVLQICWTATDLPRLPDGKPAKVAPGIRYAATVVSLAQICHKLVSSKFVVVRYERMYM